VKQLTVDHTWVETTQVDGAPTERERTVHLVISGPSNLRMGMQRSLLMSEQRALWEKEKEARVGQDYRMIDIFAEEIMRVQMYPSLVAAVTEQTGFDYWPISFELFMDLPELLGVKWEEAVAELNPHWKPEPEPETKEELEEARKKAMNGTSESSIG